MKQANEARIIATERQKQDVDRLAVRAGDEAALKAQLNQLQARTDLVVMTQQRDEAEGHRSELAQQVNKFEAAKIWSHASNTRR